ncbi:hypothetical protein SCA03_39630 [Streptomyces cacaoi]|uniref:Uncharacterized protein n=1 Tax=Streptomyces cacaoi TaxID=1898 RepID=A0A4Y3R1K7_STRCI|nr:hypothetical protein SCA03_39630 [Streptomyces cacaoi]
MNLSAYPPFRQTSVYGYGNLHTAQRYGPAPVSAACDPTPAGAEDPTSGGPSLPQPGETTALPKPTGSPPAHRPTLRT